MLIHNDDIRALEERVNDLLVKLNEFQQECEMREYMDTGDAQGLINDCHNVLRTIKETIIRWWQS